MIKMFVSDIDGTLMQSGGYIDQQDLTSLQSLDQDAIMLCFASGRLDNEIVSLMNKISSRFHRISVNGVFIYTSENKQLFSASFDPTILHKLVETTTSKRFIRYVSDEHHYYIERKTHEVLQLEKLAAMTSVEIPNLMHELGKSIFPNKISIGGKTEELLQLQTTLQHTLKGYVSTFLSASNCLDVVPIHINKGAALTKLIKQHQLKPNEIACVGDSYNDIPMFELTPYSFAVESADEEVKKYANYVVKNVREAVDTVKVINKTRSLPL
ncbi:Cof-type HAD-IIB family hydrolase [Ectobacillus polymachus]|uniref:Cof-type HAD-IIB family hydrolase n=1 Tax=Ectobacillus polymachus TaxID=1508806 RepID=UPI003A8C592A